MHLKNKSKMAEIINHIYFDEIINEDNLSQGVALHVIQIFV